MGHPVAEHPHLMQAAECLGVDLTLEQVDAGAALNEQLGELEQAESHCRSCMKGCEHSLAPITPIP